MLSAFRDSKRGMSLYFHSSRAVNTSNRVRHSTRGGSAGVPLYYEPMRVALDSDID
jgi:hypothetical protein